MRRLAPLALALALGCSNPTELVLVVDSNLRVPAELDAVVVEVTGPDGTQRSVTQSLVEADAPTFPLTLGLSPEGGALGPVTVRVAGRLGAADVVEQRAEVTLVSGTSRTLYMVLLRSCVGRMCGADSCGLSGCEPVARGELEEWDGTVPPLPNEPCLAMAWDVDRDGEGADTCGGTDCDDDAPEIFLSQVEACDLIDNNCNLDVDEGCPCETGAREPCMATCGTTGERACVSGVWEACVPPAEICNGIDDNCVDGVDEGFTYAATDPRALGTDRSNDPRIHWTGDRFVVGHEQSRNDSGVYLTTMAPDGTQLVAPVRVTDGISAFELASTGNVLALAWWDHETCGSMGEQCDRIRLRLFDLDTLAPLGGSQQVDSNASNPPRLRVVWDGTAFAVSYTDGQETELWRYDVDGQQVGASVETPRTVQSADMIWDGTSYRLVYRDDDLYMLTGTLVGGFGTPVLIPASPMFRPEIVPAGDGYLIAYSGEAFPGTVELLRIDPAGTPANAATVLSMDAGLFGTLRNREPSMTIVGEQVFVSWVESNMFNERAVFARVTLDGQVLQPATPVTAAGTRARRTHLASDGVASTWAVWSEELDPRLARMARLACPPSVP